MRRFQIIWNICFVLALMGFTGYALCDTFLISRVYSVVDAGETGETGSGSELSDEEIEEIQSEAEVDSDSYTDEHISVTVTEYNEYNTTIHVADVVVDSPEYLLTYLANGSYGKNITETTSDMADETGAILAINGDYYGTRESGYVIRNGVLYRSESAQGQEDLVIYEDGSFEIICEDDVSAKELLENNAVQVFSFGPALIENGEVSVSENDEVGKAMASNPRTAIGIIDECHYVFVVSDGRTDENEGLTLKELASFMEELGVETAYNLDGGGSSTMVFNGEVINTPTGGHAGHSSKNSSGEAVEREVSDIIYIGY